MPRPDPVVAYRLVRWFTLSGEPETMAFALTPHEYEAKGLISRLSGPYTSGDIDVRPVHASEMKALRRAATEITMEPRHDYRGGLGWSRKVTVAGTGYIVGVERGRPVRIAFKPRGQNRGYTWHGFVRDAGGKRIWEGEVVKTLGVRGLLKRAGVADHRCPPGRGECAACSSRRYREEQAHRSHVDSSGGTR